jgi:hypothetical protein
MFRRLLLYFLKNAVLHLPDLRNNTALFVTVQEHSIAYVGAERL